MLPQNHRDNAIWFIIFIILIFLVGNFIFTQYEIAQLKNLVILEQSNKQSLSQSDRISQISTPNPTASPSLTFTLIPTIRPTPSPTPTPKIVQVNQVTYLPLTSGSTQSTDWVNVPGSQFTLNIGDYGSKAYTVWDANLRVDNANGQTFARLFDTTHSIAVNGSEISVTNVSDSTDVISGALSFWQGNNTYIVQLKSLNSSTAFMDSGRIKINY